MNAVDCRQYSASRRLVNFDPGVRLCYGELYSIIIQIDHCRLGRSNNNTRREVDVWNQPPQVSAPPLFPVRLTQVDFILGVYSLLDVVDW